MHHFRRKAYSKFLKDFILMRPRLAQAWNVAQYKYHTAHHGSAEEISHYTPLSTLLFVTKRCNLTCSFCYIAQELNTRNIDEFDLEPEGLVRILSHPLVRNSLRIGFTGGEPLLNTHIFELIRIVKQRKHLLTLATNGTLIDRMLDDLLASRIDLLSISLYDDNKDKLYHNIPLVSGKMFTKLHKTVFSDKLEDMHDAISMAVELNMDGILFLNYYPTHQDIHQCVFEDNNDFYAIKEDIERTYQGKIAIEWFAPLPGEQSVALRKCRMVWQSIQVDARGNISPCCFSVPSQPLYGNIFDDHNAWNSEFFIGMRRMMNNPEIPLSPLCRHCYMLTYDYYGV